MKLENTDRGNKNNIILTSKNKRAHVVWKPLKGLMTNSTDPDQLPQNEASEGLHCLKIL